jgi:hypothetical protein
MQNLTGNTKNNVLIKNSMKKLLFGFLILSDTLFGQTKNYLLKLDYPNFGQIDFYLTFEINSKDSSFVAYSNPKSIFNLIPIQKRILLKMTGKGKKKGALIQITDGKFTQNHFGVEYIF